MKLVNNPFTFIVALLSILFCIQLFAMVDMSMDSYKQNLGTTASVKVHHVPQSANIEYKPFYSEYESINEVN